MILPETINILKNLQKHKFSGGELPHPPPPPHSSLKIKNKVIKIKIPSFVEQS